MNDKILIFFGIACSMAHPADSQTPDALIQFPGKTNVIFILTDDQGYGDLACTGNTIIRTPNLDKLHAESTRFTNFHVNPVCSPSRASLLTGRYASRVGVWRTVSGRSILYEDEKTIADLFKENGYKTAMFGKWHLGDNYPYRPQDRGFDEVLIHGGGGVGNVQDYWANDYFDDTYFRNGKPEIFKGFCTDVWFEEATKFIEKNSSQPFFCYISTNAPHLPFVCPEEYREMYKSLEPGLSEFYGMITNIDDNIGKLRDKLKELGIDKNTILIFSTDNGSARGAKVWNAGMKGWKGSPYEGGHRVPLFVHWPAGKLNSGKDIDQLAGGIDLLPTLIDLCKLNNTIEKPFDGVSLLPAINGAEIKDRIIIVDNQQRSYVPVYMHSSTCIAWDKWRFIGGSELFNVKVDSGQQNNLFSQFPDVVKKLELAYSNWFKDVYQHREFAEIHIGSPKENPVCLTAHDIVGESVWNQDEVLEGKKCLGFWSVYAEEKGLYKISLRRYPIEANQGLVEKINIPDGLKTLLYYKDLNYNRNQVHGFNYAITHDQSAPVNVSFAHLSIDGVDQLKVLPFDLQIKDNQEDYSFNERNEITSINFIVEIERGSHLLEANFLYDAGAGNMQASYYVYIEKL